MKPIEEAPRNNTLRKEVIYVVSRNQTVFLIAFVTLLIGSITLVSANSHPTENSSVRVATPPVISSPSQNATIAPDSQSALPSSASSSSRVVTLFGKLTLSYPSTWGEEMSEPDSVENIVDHRYCGDSNVNCPHINVISLASEYGRTKYGVSPVKSASQQVCFRRHDEARLMATVAVGGEEANYYTCSGGYIWVISSRAVLVTAYDGLRGDLDLDGLRQVLNQAVWRR